MKLGTARLSNGILRGKKMFDPTETQPLSWRMHQGKPMPWEDVPVEPPNRQAPTFDDSPPDRLSERGYRLRARLGGGRLGAIYEAQDELSRISGSQHFVAVLLIDSRITSRAGVRRRLRARRRRAQVHRAPEHRPAARVRTRP